MEIKGKVHCFFEQSGTFKNEFIKLGIPAEDYDIQNNFGQTDHTDDLFKAIDDAWEGKPSLFDRITKDDLILAFFPCIYFCEANGRLFTFEDFIYKNKTHREAAAKILQRGVQREIFWERALKLFAECESRGLRLIVENPYAVNHYLAHWFPYKPSVIDRNRTMRGDYFIKPTQYFFINCVPGTGMTYQPTPKEQIRSVWSAKGAPVAGLCSEERSIISPNYARNFICDFILGKKQNVGRGRLF